MFPSPFPVAHISRQFDVTSTDPDTGNPVLTSAQPVIRYVQEISQRGTGSSTDDISGDFVDRTDTELLMSVDDVSIYSTNDQVIVYPEVVGNEYVPGTGYAYWVDGLPSSQKGGPWPGLFKDFGGVIKLRRVT